MRRKSNLNRPVTDAEMRAKPSEYGGRPTNGVDVAGRAASRRSQIVRSDPTDPGRPS